MSRTTLALWCAACVAFMAAAFVYDYRGNKNPLCYVFGDPEEEIQRFVRENEQRERQQSRGAGRIEHVDNSIEEGLKEIREREQKEKGIERGPMPRVVYDDYTATLVDWLERPGANWKYEEEKRLAVDKNTRTYWHETLGESLTLENAHGRIRLFFASYGQLKVFSAPRHGDTLDTPREVTTAFNSEQYQTLLVAFKARAKIEADKVFQAKREQERADAAKVIKP